VNEPRPAYGYNAVGVGKNIYGTFPGLAHQFANPGLNDLIPFGMAKGWALVKHPMAAGQTRARSDKCNKTRCKKPKEINL